MIYDVDKCFQSSSWNALVILVANWAITSILLYGFNPLSKYKPYFNLNGNMGNLFSGFRLWCTGETPDDKPRSRKPPTLFLFLGPKESGKTTVLKHIYSTLVGFRSHVSGNPAVGQAQFLHDLESKFDLVPDNNSFQKWFYEDEQGYRMDLVEAPSFSSSLNINDNASKITELYYFLERFSDVTIPTKVFITARLTDNRFEGESSEFSKLLKTLKYLGNRLTDCNWSNVVLLLTHADRPDISDTKKERVNAYIAQFKQVLGVKPLCFMTGNTIAHFKMTRAEVLGIQQRDPVSFATRPQPDKLLKHIMDLVNLPIENCTGRVPSALITYLGTDVVAQSNVFSQTRLQINFLGTDHTFISKRHDLGYFSRDALNLRYDLQLSTDNVYNVVESNAQILLSDGNSISASECFVGDRLLGHKGVGVVTKCVKMKCKGVELGANRSESASILVAEIVLLVAQEENSRFIGLARDSDRYSFVDYPPKWLNEFRNKDISVVYIEVDGGSGTFLANGYVRKSYAGLVGLG